MVAATDAADAAVAAVGEDATDDNADVDAADGGEGKAEAAIAPRGAFNVDRMSSRIVEKGGWAWKRRKEDRRSGESNDEEENEGVKRTDNEETTPS